MQQGHPNRYTCVMPDAPVDVVQIDAAFRAEIWECDPFKKRYTVRYFGPNGKDFGHEEREASSPKVFVSSIREKLLELRAKYPHGITETEFKVIEILTQHGVVRDAWTDPIYAVDRAMGWAPAYTKEFVTALINRNLLEYTPIAGNQITFDPKACWKKGSAHPDNSEENGAL